MTKTNNINMGLSPAAHMLKAAFALKSSGHLFDPEGAAINAQAMETLLRHQQGQLEICPVTKNLDTSSSILASDIEQGRRQTDAFVAFTDFTR